MHVVIPYGISPRPPSHLFVVVKDFFSPQTGAPFPRTLHKKAPRMHVPPQPLFTKNLHGLAHVFRNRCPGSRALRSPKELGAETHMEGFAHLTASRHLQRSVEHGPDFKVVHGLGPLTHTTPATCSNCGGFSKPCGLFQAVFRACHAANLQEPLQPWRAPDGGSGATQMEGLGICRRGGWLAHDLHRSPPP